MSAPTGTIYDLGYKRYLGTRRPQSTRWRVIMRHQIATAWKKWWRYKLALFFAIVNTFVFGSLMYLKSLDVVRAFDARGPNPVTTWLDAALPFAYGTYCTSAFVLTLTLGATIIAGDSQNGAFVFYYVRSIRPIDYVLGKLAGFGTLVASIILVPPLLLAGFRLGMSKDVDAFVADLIILPKVLAIGSLATLAYTAVPLAISSVIANRRYALAMWAAYYVIMGGMAVGIAHVIRIPAIAAIDPKTAIMSLTYGLFDFKLLKTFVGLEASTAAALLAAQGVIAIAVIWFSVSRDQSRGVGGAG